MKKNKLELVDIIGIIAMLALFIFLMISYEHMKVDAEYMITGKTLLSDEQVAVIDDVAEEFGICPEFVMAVCEYESGGNQNCTNNLGCTGLMQIYPKYNRERMRKYRVTNLRDPRQNVTIGCDLLAELFDKYEDSALVLMKYHGENKAQQKYEEGQMSSYAKKILVRSEELERMRGK